MSERWARIVGWPYEVSDRGRVRRAETRRVLRPGTDRYGYLVVRLSREGEVTDFKVHRLVCAAFVGDPPAAEAQVRHLNGVRIDNDPRNLSWGSAADNAADRDGHGTTRRGENHSRARLTQTQADELRTRHAAAQRGRLRVPRGLLPQLAAEYGITRHAVATIVSGRGYAST